MTRFDEQCWICEVQESIIMDSGGGGGSPAGNTTTVQKSDPWAGQQPYLTTGFQQVQDLYNTGGPQYFPGQTYAGPTDAQNQALTAQQNFATSGSGGLSAASSNAAQNILDPSFLNSNPGNAMYSQLGNGQAMNDAIQNAVTKATPGLLDTFTQGNRLNSPGAAFAVSNGIASAAAPYVYQGQQAAAQGLSQNYQGAAQLQNQANLLAPQSQQMGYTDAANLYNAGATDQTQQQASINDAMARYNYDQTQPYNLANWYNAGVGGSYGSTGTLTSPYFQQQSGGFGGALTGAVGGGALGYMLGGGTGAMYGAGAGGLLGGLI